MREVDKLTLTVLVENTTDMLSTRPKGVKTEMQMMMKKGMKVLNGQAGCVAMHGLSILIETERDGEKHTLLFDAGPDGYGIERNGESLGVDFSQIEAIALSHGHYDHSEGMLRAIQLIRAKNGGARIPFYAHPDAFYHRALKLANGEMLPVQDVPSVAALEEAGVDVKLNREGTEILDNTFYIGGEIERTSFEDGYRGHYRLDDAGKWVPDPLVIDERYVVVNVRNKGLVVFIGCAHPGVINILSDVKKRFPDTPIYAVVGGLHLCSVNEDRIPMTIKKIGSFGAKKLYVGHCTGWRAVDAMVKEFGEDVVDQINVGTQHHVFADE